MTLLEEDWLCRLYTFENLFYWKKKIGFQELRKGKPISWTNEIMKGEESFHTLGSKEVEKKILNLN